MSRHLELEIMGMSCDNCVRHVTEALESIPGVSNVKVDLAAGRATLDAEPKVIPEHLYEAVEDAGYQARPAGGSDDD